MQRHLFRIDLEGKCPVDDAQLFRNVVLSEKVSCIQPQPPHGRKLAIVGGGSSVRNHLDELRNWDGDIWSINYTGSWLASQGIQSVLTTVDPIPLDSSAFEGMSEAIIASSADPSLFEYFGDKARKFHIREVDPDGVGGGSGTASRLPSVALRMGYTKIFFFGCEGSYLSKTHIDRDEKSEGQLVVSAGGVDYLTRADFLLFCQELGEIIREFPDVFIDMSGGLLSAIISNWDTWGIVAVAKDMKDQMETLNGCPGMFGKYYEWSTKELGE